MAGRAKRSAGILLFRRSVPREVRTDSATSAESPATATELDVEVLLGHLGGPFFAKRDAGAWTIPKGEIEAGEEPRATAAREFAEELGLPVPAGRWCDLGEVRQAGGKHVAAWAVEADLDLSSITLGTFSLEWPPRSGRVQEFPELDRVAWLGMAAAAGVIVTAQRTFLDRLRVVLDE